MPPSEQVEPAGTTEPAETTAPAEKAPATVPAILPPAQIHLRILNAGSRTGYAKEVAADLKRRGYQVDEVGNSNSRYGESVILYPTKLQREGRRLARQTSITTTDVMPDNGGPATITLVVV